MCYKLVVNDTEGDGFCCNYGNGNISVNKVLDNQEIAQLSYFNFSDTINFCISALSNSEILINKVKVFPSPTNGILFFNSDIFMKDIPIIAQVFDLGGRLVFSKKITKGEINLSNFEDGIYILELKQRNKITKNKIILNKL